MANEEEENKDADAAYFSISTFFKGIRDSLYAFFVSAGNAIQRLYAMFEAAIARKMHDDKTRYSRVSSTKSREDEQHLSKLLAYYEQKIANNHIERVFRVPQADEQEEPNDALFPEKAKARELMHRLQVGTDCKDTMYSFILSFVKHRQSIRHLDFSMFYFSGAALNRFEFFLSELLSVNSQITQLRFHADNVEHFRTSPVTFRLNKHRKQVSAYRLLTDNTEKHNPLSNKTTLAFFKKNQEHMIEEFTEKSAHFLNVITPEAQKNQLHTLMNQKEDVPVNESTPWYFIAWARRELNEKLAHVLSVFKKDPSPNTSVKQEQSLIAVSSENVTSYASMAYSLLANATHSIASAVSNFISPQEESPFSYLDEKDPKENQLRAITSEAERILALWKNFEAFALFEPKEERMKAQARIVASVLYQGLYLPAAMDISDPDRSPEIQKATLFHPDGRCRSYPWHIYGDALNDKKNLHAKAFNIIQHEAMVWLDNLNTNKERLSIAPKITEYIQTQRDIALIDIAGQRQNRALDRQGEALDRQGEALERMRKTQEENAEMLDEYYRLDKVLKEGKARKAREVSTLKQSDSSDSFFNVNKEHERRREETTDQKRVRSFPVSQTG